MTEHDALVALNMVTGMGVVTARRLHARFGSFAKALEADETELRSVPGIGPEKSASFATEFRTVELDRELSLAEKLKVTIVTLADPDYPKLLAEIADPPLVLYLRGEVSAMDRAAVAIVGTRHPTMYGREAARKFGYHLAGAGYTVVSGLAVGIDAEAHSGAVKSGGLTVGVLGGALDCFFPKENAPLAREIVQHGGAVVSEYSFGRQPDRQTFPMRNRIVSGLCKGVLVVESPLSSGTMITVSQALDQNRTVMAVPGRIDSPASQGCHRLIRQGARMVTNADEVIEELQDLVSNMRNVKPSDPPRDRTTAAKEGRPAPALSDEERRVYDTLSAEGISIDQVVRLTGLDAAKVSSILIVLQIKRLAKSLPGGRAAKVV